MTQGTGANRFPRNLDASNAAAPAWNAEEIDISAADWTPPGSPSYTVAKALWVGTGGTVKVDMEGDGENAGATVTFAGVLGGTLLPVRVTKVYMTGTSASDLVALY